MTTTNLRRLTASIGMSAIVLSAFLLVACGGGGGGGGGGGSQPAATGTLSGSVSKGPVSGATVRAYAVDNGTKGRQLGSAQTDANGNFTMTVDAYSGPVMLRTHGGSYTDEATGARMNMLDADDMTCAIPSITVAAGSMMTGIQITPLTSMAQAWAEHMSGGMTMTNVTAANMRVGAVYLGPGMDILMTHPIDTTVTGSANGASVEAKYYGMMLAAMSQEAHDLGMTTSSSAMVTAMLDDASDGIMDGRMGGTAINMSGMGGMMGGGNMMNTTGTSQMWNAMEEFIRDNPMNRSGVTGQAGVDEMQELMNRLTHLEGLGGQL